MDNCDICWKVAELYYNEATGLALCEKCDSKHPEEIEQTINKKYYAQIVIEVELKSTSNFAAYDELEKIVAEYDFDPKYTKFLSTNIVAKPSDDEFLERFARCC